VTLQDYPGSVST